MKKGLVILGVTVAIMAGCSSTNGGAATETNTNTKAAETNKEKVEMVIPDIADKTHASNEVVATLNSFFNIKSTQDVEGTMSFFDKSVEYYDVTLGWPFTYDVLKSTFEEYMPNWGEGKSYATKIIGDENSAMVLFTDTPELFGEEIRLIGSVTFNDEGKITRWVDYWDGNTWSQDYLRQTQTSAEQYQADLGEDIKQNASEKIRNVSKQLNDALSANDYEAAAALFAYDGVFEDMTLRTEIEGPAAIARFFEKATQDLPYGADTTIRYVVGGDQGGGYEWANANSSVPRGTTALELNDEGKITGMTVVWDGSLMDDAELTELVTKTIDNY
ncbi:nuclear transport factor 2 family protein [Paenibacillus sp. FA6]|uniref:nuclear transport factor 2 family protein n=1 Tax=Paenibacillus sp. FA6 TaxID=3413029 RepID=UPI003F656997